MADPTGDITIDIIEGARWREEDGVVTEISRLAIASGLSGGEQSFTEALKHTSMPQPGASHPLKGHLIVRARNPVAISGKIIQVEIVYKQLGSLDEQPPPGTNSVVGGETALEQIKTEFDKFGNQITLTHNGITRGGSVNIQRPRDRLTFTRIEQSLAPGVITRAFTGKTNLFLWNGGIPGTWLCDRIPFDQENPTLKPPSYRFSYQFKHDPGGWNPQVVFIDPETGEPPPDLVSGEGFKTVEIYDQVNFDFLGL